MPNFPNFPIPSDTPEQTRCICLEIPDNEDWIQVFAGLLAIPSYWFNWQRDDARSGTVLAQHWTKIYDQIDWSTMSCCCDTVPVQYRYTEDGTLERSTDGGVTWTPSPEYDPRYNSPQFPPISGSDGNDKKCAASEGMMLLIQEGLTNNLTDDMSRYTLDELIKNWVTTVIASSNPLEALLRVITNQIFALVISALRAALTTEVFDQLKCILYCEMEDDASFTEASWGYARSRVLAEITGIAGIFIEHILFLIGAVGMTNLARSGAVAEGDCTDCECPSVEVWFAQGATYELQLPDEGTENEYTLAAYYNEYNVYAFYQLFANIPPFPDGTGAIYQSIEVVSGAYEVRGQYNKDTGATSANWPGDDACSGGIYAESSIPFTVKIIVNPCP